MGQPTGGTGLGTTVAREVLNRPPVPSARSLIVTWLTVAVGLGLLLGIARSTEGPLDDPDPAWQRPGFLDAGELPVPAPRLAPDVPAPGRPTVVFFERAGRLASLCSSLASAPLRQGVATAVVVAGGPSHWPVEQQPADECGDIRMVSDPASALADAYGMRRPRGGGPAVGYAIVDGAGAIRYRTLDPSVGAGLDEVATMVSALP